MDLLVTQGEISTLWMVERDKRATRLYFQAFGERDLCPPSHFLRSAHLPIEILEKILLIMFQHYIKTWNFDLCIDLFSFSRSFTGLVYRAIYGANSLPFYRQYSRLHRTFQILENIYENYLSLEGDVKYHCVKLVSIRPAGSRHQPWDFMHQPQIFPIVGTVVDLTETQLQVRYGRCYGETVWLSGRYHKGVFRAQVLKTPVINIMFTDVFDTLIHDSYTLNNNFRSFLELVKKAFGDQTVVFVMVKEDGDGDNPFVTRSELFLEF